jgi:hypothetical protein
VPRAKPRQARIRYRDPEFVKVPPLPTVPLRDDMRLSIPEAAAYFRATPRQVYRWLSKDQLDYAVAPNGRDRLIRGSDIRRLLDIADTVSSSRKGRR